MFVILMKRLVPKAKAVDRVLCNAALYVHLSLTSNVLGCRIVKTAHLSTEVLSQISPSIQLSVILENTILMKYRINQPV
ncbi:hypothetical protein KUCAC02_008574 [Chaenocephalus aceratus]|uniref:Uncharacterized protein n=1 Tax=Chaenocephalus aceratus TaxID=36190 RepID=A0ACB9WQW3_CHAAC|nr:hypothetical protein KUCAC02_008574 [Chaenocephalus aceratus]